MKRPTLLITIFLAFAVAVAPGWAAACPTRSVESFSIGSEPGLKWSAGPASGAAVYSVGNVGCEAIDPTGHCTSGVWPTLDGASWVWLPAPRSEQIVKFSTSFRIPPSAKNIDGELSMTADNAYRAYLNGKLVGTGGPFDVDGPDESTWSTIFSHEVHPAKRNNVLVIRVVNYFGPSDESNPAGLIFRLDVSYTCPGRSCKHGS